LVSPAGAFKPNDLDAFGKQLIASDQKTYAHVAVIEEKLAEIDHQPARSILLDYERGDEKLRRLYIFTLKDAKAYTFFYTGDVQEFDKWKPDVEKVVASVRWVAAGAT